LPEEVRNLKHYLRFVLVWLVNSLLIYFASMLYPENFVLGTAMVSGGYAPFVAGLTLTVLCKLGKWLITKLGVELKGRYSKFLYYWLVNSVGIWLIARFSPYTGLGISAYYWALSLGFVASLLQWLLRQVFKKTKSL
jgi:uncharacterized membrane protein YvlD (DUF360 family)